MISGTPSRTVFVIVATSGILSGTFVASATPQEEQHDNLASPAASQGASLATDASAIPTVAGFYALPIGDGGGMRVSFVQNANVLTAIWMLQNGKIYGRGTYRWDPVLGAFKGTSTTRHTCFGDEGEQSASATVLIREELYVLNEHELRDWWTKPLTVDCSAGLTKTFKWVGQTWMATDKDWKPR